MGGKSDQMPNNRDQMSKALTISQEFHSDRTVLHPVNSFKYRTLPS